MRTRFSLVVVSILCVAILPMAAFAQNDVDGQVRTSDGITLVSGVTVQADGQNGMTYTDTTNGTGQYAMNVESDFYDLFLKRSNSGQVLNVTAPASFSFKAVDDLVVTTDQTQNMNLPAFATVSGRTTHNTVPTGGVKVEAQDASGTFDCYDVTWSAATTLKGRAVGDYVLTLIPGTYDFAATYPDMTVVNKNGINVTDGLQVLFDSGNIPSFMSPDQNLDFSSTAGCWMAIFNYELVDWHETLDASAGNQSITYPLPMTQWLGAFLYDYANSAWEHGMYIYSDSVY